MSTVRLFLALVSIHNWHLEQLDVHNAFLHGDLDEEIYMELPVGLQLKGDSQLEGKKLVYYSLFIRSNKDDFVALLVYVDDIILGSSSLTAIDSVKAYLHDQFKIRDLGMLKYFLGLEVARSKSGIHVCQRKYALKIIESAGLLGSKVVTTPMEPNHKLTHSSGECLSDVTGYHRLIGKLIYLSTTRPDITYFVGILSQFMDKPTHTHVLMAHRILKYLKGSVG
ncbi:hypothetical protein F2P56_023495 [Juglans regia]|uniref:Reverse transcriptase Ty1/copia-type domain-containing protein n=1 Tax=Juglans regia TaxID=51240 RepID=A0A833X968_JUGRE|nr:hypothetical protein F2P56_023495 [Juglans regia]